MGPYGVDRAVHSLEFTDCENGLGKYSLSLLSTGKKQQQDTDFVFFLAKNKHVVILLGAVVLRTTAYIVNACNLFFSFFFFDVV